jgi:mono/diheme cytochrome c family protein
MIRSGWMVTVLAGAFTIGITAGALAQGKGDAAAGGEVYKKECAKCHGDAGAGDGPMGQKLKDKPSDWTKGGGGLKDLDDQKIFTAVTKGGVAVGKSRAMPGYPKLSEADVWNVVAYMKTLKK